MLFLLAEGLCEFGVVWKAASRLQFAHTAQDDAFGQGGFAQGMDYAAIGQGIAA